MGYSGLLYLREIDPYQFSAQTVQATGHFSVRQSLISCRIKDFFLLKLDLHYQPTWTWHYDDQAPRRVR